MSRKKDSDSLLGLGPVLGELERQVMSVLWQRNQGTVREVLEVLRQEREIAYTTVLTVMRNLFNKGYLTREKCGRAYRYQPQETREHLVKNQVAGIVKKLLREYQDLAALQFIKQSDFLDPELKEKILAELKQDEK